MKNLIGLKLTAAKSFGSLMICLWIAVPFLLVYSFGYFSCQKSENILQYIFPCTFNRDAGAFAFPDNWLKPAYCPPVENIFFLKTHKCASSTVQNIFMRYGDERNLSFILPKDSNYIGYPEHFSWKLISEQLPTQPHFNILCHHLRFNSSAVREVLPQTTIYISILRNPVSLFRSMYDYYNMSDFFHQTIDEFFQDEKSMEKLSTDRIYHKLGRNQMLFDFGCDKNVWGNETLLHNAIDEIDKTFHLVMIQELFDESLILLRHKLCWTTADIVYLKHNMRTDKLEIKENSKLSLKIEHYNAADKMVYDYFLQKLNSNINSFGRERMRKAVADLRLWNTVWFNHCVRKVSNLHENVPIETRAYNSKVYSFILNDEPIAEICKHLAMEELPYTDKLRTKQNLQ